MRKLVIIKKKKIRVYRKRALWRKVISTAAAIGIFVFAVPALQTGAQEPNTGIYHQHIGNEVEGGGCYGEPVYHYHTGTEAEGGVCYQTPVYHVHQGSEADGGACYQTPVFHQHRGDSITGGECFTPVYHTHDNNCYQTAVCIVAYQKGEDIRSYQEECYHHNMTNHIEAAVTTHHGSCGEADGAGVISYCAACGNPYHYTEHSYTRLVCTLGEQTIIGYSLNCSKTGETIDGYLQSCEKTDSSIDSYSLSCMKDSNTVDAYRLNCGLTENIYIPKETTAQETEENASEEPSGDASDDAPALERSTPSASPTVTPVTEQAAKPPVNEASSKQVGKKNQSEEKQANTAVKTPVPTHAPKIVKETVTSSLPQTKAMDESKTEPEQTELKRGFWTSPKTRLITITTSGVLLIAGLCLFLFLGLRSVKIWNDDGKGRMIFIGRCMVKETEEGYMIRLTKKLTEKASTGRYCICPGLFRLGKKEDQELIICREAKRISVRIAKEMVFTI